MVLQFILCVYCIMVTFTQVVFTVLITAFIIIEIGIINELWYLSLSLLVYIYVSIIPILIMMFVLGIVTGGLLKGVLYITYVIFMLLILFITFSLRMNT